VTNLLLCSVIASFPSIIIVDPASHSYALPPSFTLHQFICNTCLPFHFPILLALYKKLLAQTSFLSLLHISNQRTTSLNLASTPLPATALTIFIEYHLSSFTRNYLHQDALRSYRSGRGSPYHFGRFSSFLQRLPVYASHCHSWLQYRANSGNAEM
jgi:hypothetical protein